MAKRASYVLVGMVAGLVLGTAIAVTHAQEADANTIQAAKSAGVAVVDLEGAMATTGLDAAAYLCAVGEGPCPSVLAAAIVPSIPYGIWDRLAACESSGNWASRSNPIYKGGVQMDATFWARYGGLAYAPRPDLATRAQQIQVAERGLAVQGWQAWPVCSRVIGMR